MKIKEVATYTLSQRPYNATEEAQLAEVMARHILATEGDPEIIIGIRPDDVGTLRRCAARYDVLLQTAGVTTEEGRAIIESHLDAEISRRGPPVKLVLVH